MLTNSTTPKHLDVPSDIHRMPRGVWGPGGRAGSGPQQVLFAHPFLFSLAASAARGGVLAVGAIPRESDAIHSSRCLQISVKPMITLYERIGSSASNARWTKRHLLLHTCSRSSDSGLTPVLWYLCWRNSSSSSASSTAETQKPYFGMLRYLSGPAPYSEQYSS